MFEGLRFSMDDQTGVRVRDRVCDLEEQVESLCCRQPALIGKLVDSGSLDMLEHEIRLASRCHAGVQQSSNVRVSQSREQRALTLEALVALGSDKGEVEQLDGDEAFEAAIDSPRAPDSAHAAHAERHVQLVRATVCPASVGEEDVSNAGEDSRKSEPRSRSWSSTSVRGLAPTAGARFRRRRAGRRGWRCRARARDRAAGSGHSTGPCRNGTSRQLYRIPPVNAATPGPWPSRRA